MHSSAKTFFPLMVSGSTSARRSLSLGARDSMAACSKPATAQLTLVFSIGLMAQMSRAVVAPNLPRLASHCVRAKPWRSRYSASKPVRRRLGRLIQQVWQPGIKVKAGRRFGHSHKIAGAGAKTPCHGQNRHVILQALFGRDGRPQRRPASQAHSKRPGSGESAQGPRSIFGHCRSAAPGRCRPW